MHDAARGHERTDAIDLTEIEVLALLQRHDTHASARSLELLDNRSRHASAEVQRLLGEHGIVSLLVRGLARDEGGPKPEPLPHRVAEVFGTAERWVRLLAEIDGVAKLSLVAASPAGIAVAEPRGYGVWAFSAAATSADLGETIVHYLADIVFTHRSPSAIIDLFLDGDPDTPRLAIAADVDRPGTFAVVSAFADDDLNGAAATTLVGQRDEQVANHVQRFLDSDGTIEPRPVAE